MIKIILSAILICTLFPVSVFAQISEEETEPYEARPPQEMSTIYAPESCEFTIGFPSEPEISERCDGGESGDECYQQVLFTQTFGISATVNVRAVCNPIGEDIKDKYDRQIMVATLEEMTKGSIVNTYETSYYEDDENRYRLAGLVGEGKVGMTPSIFIAQMWLGQNSAFSIEAEIVGDAFAEPDSLFRDILRSVRYKDNETNGESDDAPIAAPENGSSRP
ncbi:MAG: hypothetical protein ACLFR0_00270 [Alphaproteobacteria bacterium]